MAPACFLAAAGLDIPCRLLLCAPNFVAAAQNGLWCPSACETGTITCTLMLEVEIGGVQIVPGWGVANRACMQQHVSVQQHIQVFKFPSLMGPQPASNWGSLGCELYTQPGSNWRPSAC